MRSPLPPPFTLADTARDILAEVDLGNGYRGQRLQRARKDAAQLYLDNLSDGYNEPSELIELLAEEQALEIEPYADFDRNRDCWIAATRSTYGMAGVCA